MTSNVSKEFLSPFKFNWMKACWLLCICLLGSFSLRAQSVSKYIVIDQFGYPETSKKVAVIRNPETGFDAAESFIPGNVYRVVNKVGQSVFEGAPTSWKSGQTDASSGDKAWWFDFSVVTTPGEYYILDVARNVKSYNFMIHNSVYQDVLKQAVRSYYYQRTGVKEARYAGTGWADAASYAGPLQDTQARLYSAKNDASTQKDLSGGWYDAGDMNKYVNFVHNLVVQLLMAYEEKPAVWADNYNIPESGNGIPDLLDEVKYEMDWLLKMQNDNGSVLSIVGYQADASPPSSDITQRCYGPATTSATLTGAALYAYAAKVFRSLNRPEMNTYAQRLQTAAVKAWNWADANPNVTFRNNEGANNSQGLGAGQQEVSNYNRTIFKLSAATFLFALTKGDDYKTYVDAHYTDAHLVQWGYAYPFEPLAQDVVLYYAAMPEATASVATSIKNAYTQGIDNADNFQAFTSNTDPYRAFLKDYTWGSNSTKSIQGNMFYSMVTRNLDAARHPAYREAAEGYIHYLHGVNPLQFVYLSNMFAYGAENGVREFYHAWFKDGSARWDRIGTSQFGPPPGFLTGGPNPQYNWDEACPNVPGCNSESITPPMGQPDQKSYKDFNTSWPLNSWEVTENSTSYQANYIRLLSKFVTLSNNVPLAVQEEEMQSLLQLYPNPASGLVTVDLSGLNVGEAALIVTNLQGTVLQTLDTKKQKTVSVDVSGLANGIYLIQLTDSKNTYTRRLVINR